MKWFNPDDLPVPAFQRKAHDINPLCPQKRLRVWEERIDDVIESLKPSNYLTELYRYLKGCDNLHRSYPNHEQHINEIRIIFWAKYKHAVKTRIIPIIKRWKREDIMNDLKRMGFVL